LPESAGRTIAKIAEIAKESKLEKLRRIAVIAVIARDRETKSHRGDTETRRKPRDLTRICADERGLNDLAAN